MVLHDGTVVALLVDVGRDGVFCADERGAIVAGAGAATVGRVAYVRVYGPRAVLTLEVDEAFWQRGLPELLLARLCACAARVGISTFVMRMRACDVRLLALLVEQFAAREVREGAHVDLELPTAAGAIGVDCRVR